MNTPNCNENFMGVIASVLAVPDEAIDFYVPLSCEEKVLDASFFVCDYQRGFELMAKKKSIQVSEGTSVSLSGDAYDVKISWTVDAPDIEESKSACEQFKKLKNSVNHLFIRAVDGHRYLLRVHEGAYSFDFIEKEGVYDCLFKAHSVSGLQRIPID